MDNENFKNPLNSIEIDTIGEILNISMGSAATSVSTLLGRKVNITTPVVSVVKTNELEFENLEPAIGIEIEYIEGLSGSNLMFMKRTDIKLIVDLLISGMDDVSEEEMREMELSAISEIMNQMMGASSTALASFFGKSINISTPKPFDPINILEKIEQSYNQDTVVCVKFILEVEDLLQSEFLTVMTIDFTKEIVNNALNFDEAEMNVSEEKQQGDNNRMEPQSAQMSVSKTVNDAKKEERPVKKEAPPPPPPQTPPPSARPQPTPQPQPVQQQVNVRPLKLRSFDEEYEDDRMSEEEKDNFNLILDVPLGVTVEIGKTSMMVKNVLQLRQGSIVELDKQAGDPVDVIVNGKLIARGDVVIIDDNFGVRITEIVTSKEISKSFN